MADEINNDKEEVEDPIMPAQEEADTNTQEHKNSWEEIKEYKIKIEKVIELTETKLTDLEEKKLYYEQTLETRIEKLIEDNELLINKIEDLESKNKELQKRNDQLEEERKPLKEYDSEILESLISPVNTIDQIASAYRNTGENELIAEQLEKVAELTIHQISKAGIEEIPVYGKEMDGEYMESFGPASHVKDKTLPAHTVAIVSRRAFKKKDTDEIIQNALVYTVPEEDA